MRERFWLSEKSGVLCGGAHTARIALTKRDQETYERHIVLHTEIEGEQKLRARAKREVLCMRQRRMSSIIRNHRTNELRNLILV